MLDNQSRPAFVRKVGLTSISDGTGMADIDDQPALAPNTGVGSRLKAARESAGLSLAQISERTKIPERMLLLIEAGDFAALPARTYATGFTRSYARTLGLDEQAYVAAVREEIGMADPAQPAPPQTFEPGDPARIPSARFAWLAALAALAVIAAGLFLWRSYYAPAVSPPALIPSETATAAPAAPTASAPALPLATPDPLVTTSAPPPTATGAPSAAARRRPAPAPASEPATVPLEATLPAPASTATN